MWKSGALGRFCTQSQTIVFMIIIITPLKQLSSQGAVFEFLLKKDPAHMLPGTTGAPNIQYVSS